MPADSGAVEHCRSRLPAPEIAGAAIDRPRLDRRPSWRAGLRHRVRSRLRRRCRGDFHPGFLYLCGIPARLHRKASDHRGTTPARQLGAWRYRQAGGHYKAVRRSQAQSARYVLAGFRRGVDTDARTIAHPPPQFRHPHTQALESAAHVTTLNVDMRLRPPQFTSMLFQSANSFKNPLADAPFKTLAPAYRNQGGGPFRDVTKDHYPFARSAQTEIPPLAFGQVFGGGGYFDSFFKKNLEDLADISQGDWKLRKKESPVANRMSDETLRQFQRAARIRAAFFPGNGNTPIVTLNVTPPMLAGTGLIAKLWISGVPIISSSQPGAVAPQQVQWTGTAGSKTDVSLEQDPPNPRVPPSEQLSNPRNTTSWALLRLLDRATKSAIPNGINASWALLARDVSFQIVLPA